MGAFFIIFFPLKTSGEPQIWEALYFPLLKPSLNIT